MTEPKRSARLDEPVVRHMRLDFTPLSAEETVGQGLESLRRNPPGGRIIYFYVTDAEGRLVGVVPTRRLLLSPLDARLADVMIRQVVALPETATVSDACDLFILHRLLALPVVDADRHLVGVVDVEVYTDELQKLETHERSDDLFELIGVHLAKARQASLLSAFRIRFPWLLCNIAGGVLAALLAGLYQHELERVVALALFLPVVLALAESVSIQSVSLVLQSLRAEKPSWSSLLRKLGRELPTGLFLGAASGALVGLVGLLWIGQPGVALCLLGGIAGGVTAAAGVGLTAPYLLRLLRLNPQVAAGPLALASADMLTLLIYFNLARWLL
jgi:magnesium transporter